jgi:hypothetical protein
MQLAVATIALVAHDIETQKQNKGEYMVQVPSYSKVLTLGALGTEQALSGTVVMEEKVDGSQFAWGIDENGEIGCRSHHQQIVMDAAGMFAEAADHVCQMETRLKADWDYYERRPIWFYCEYLRKPRQNTLSYNRIPKNHLVLFDVKHGNEWVAPGELCYWADAYEIDTIPMFWWGEGASLDTVKSWLTRESYLGGPIVEGVVVKNYEQLIAIGGTTYPLFCKLVNEAFKERNAKEWKQNGNKNRLQELMESYCTQARWQKAVQRLEEQGQLEHSPRDIGALMRAVGTDLLEEEGETIKAELFKLFWKDIVRTAQYGLAEWYKAQLAERVQG